MHVIFTASEDGVVKLWDRKNGDCVHQLKADTRFFSLDHNKQMICAGSIEDVIFWDLRKMKQLMRYSESHSDEVSCVCFNPANPQQLLTASTDNLCCLFDFNQKPSNSEDDTLEGVYSSSQPLIACGYIGNDMFWV